jgi:oligopeptide/dipeptide ABC transporter ATP-binding protein
MDQALQSSAPVSGAKKILEVKDLSVNFMTYAGTVEALDKVVLSVRRGEALGLVGESGCGKSVTAATVEGLLPDNARVVGGEVLLDGADLLMKSKKEMRSIRARDVAIVFQDPMTFLNPVLTVGQQLTEVLAMNEDAVASEIAAQAENPGNGGKKASGSRSRFGRGEKNRALRRLGVRALEQVGLPDPERVFDEYPHELSGGMRQRAMIAMALVRNPKVFIADEITTALDVTTQAQILEMLRNLRREFDSAILVITHDLGIVANLCDTVSVMYAGNVVETAEIHELFADPLHPYTKGLLKAIPTMTVETERLEPIPGSVPDLIHPPTGCRFHPRCPFAYDLCLQERPPHIETKPGHWVECHLYEMESN